MNVFHQVVIRFSLRVDAWQEKVNGILSEELRNRWFIYRVGLFCRTVLPSLLSQTKRLDRLVLLFDNEDKSLWKNYFEPLLKDLPFEVNPVFEGWNFSAELQKLSNNISSSFTNLNQIRMDSDDLLSCDFIRKNEDILLNVGGYKYIVFPVGLRFDKCNWQRLDYCDNPFLSYCVNRGEFHNILSINHEKVREFPFFLSAESSFMWAQYVHDYNVSNKFRDLQTYDGFRSHPIQANDSFDFALFGLNSQALVSLFNLEGYK